MGWFLVGTIGAIALLLVMVWLAWLTGGLSHLIRAITSRIRLGVRNLGRPIAGTGDESP